MDRGAQPAPLEPGRPLCQPRRHRRCRTGSHNLPHIAQVDEIIRHDIESPWHIAPHGLDKGGRNVLFMNELPPRILSGKPNGILPIALYRWPVSGTDDVDGPEH